MKLFSLLLISILMIGLVSAAYGVNIKTDSSVKSNESNNSNGIGSDLSLAISVKKAELKAGNYTGPLGQALNVRQMSADLRELRSNGVSAETRLNITSEEKDGKTTLKAHLSNGQESEIKVMPDRASETAITKLKLSSCSTDNNCTIELKEVGTGSKARAAYTIKADKQVKVLGLFKAKANIEANVDAETQEVISTHTPWWTSISTG